MRLHITGDEIPDNVLNKLDKMFEKVFVSAQLCWWYALYSDDYHLNFTKEEMLRYSDCICENNRKYRTDEDTYSVCERIREYCGLDIKRAGKAFSYSRKTKMYGRKVDFKLAKLAMMMFSDAISNSILLALVTLMDDFKLTQEGLMQAYNDFLDVSKWYDRGIKDEHFKKYFSEFESIPVYD